jgi:hypothetical protein
MLGGDLNPLSDELEDAWQAGILIFAPAGDNHLDGVNYPAYDDNVVAVGVSTESGPGFPHPLTSYGDETEVIAAGVDVPVLDVVDSGCRYSSSLAASAAALVLSYRPSWSNSQVRALLHATATPLVPSDYEWASKYDPITDLTFCRGYGEVDVFDALRTANYAKDWWSEDEVISHALGAVQSDRRFRPDIAIDRHGNSHVVWCQFSGGVIKLFYNSYSARGDRIFMPDIEIASSDGLFRPEWPDVEVGAGDKVYIIWTRSNDNTKSAIMWYTQLLRGHTVVQSQVIYEPQSPYSYPQYLNLMISEHPYGKAHIVFSIFRTGGIVPDRKVAYIDVDPAGNPGNFIQIWPDPNTEPNNIDTNAPSADLGRVSVVGVGVEDRVMYVYEEDVTDVVDDWDVFWNCYIPSTQSNYLGSPLLLRPPITIPGGLRYDWELCPDISVDLETAESFIVWDRRVRTGVPAQDYDILEYTWLSPYGTDLTGWSEGGSGGQYGSPGDFPYKIRVSQIGEPSDHAGIYGDHFTPGERMKMWPSISYNTHSSKWDKIGFQMQGHPVSYSTITWSEKTATGWGIYYTYVMPNGREILPDEDHTDQMLSGEGILFKSALGASQGPPAIDSGFESESDIYDESGNINAVWGNGFASLSFISTKEYWQTDAQLVDSVKPDVAVDSDDNFHVAWETSPGQTDVQYRSWNNLVPGVPNARFATQDVSDTNDLIVSKDPQILYTKEGETEHIHILWIEDKTIDELYYRRYDTNGNPETNPVLVGFMPQNRDPMVESFDIFSFELGYDAEEQIIHVVYHTYTILDTEDPYVPEMLLHGSITTANAVHHPEAIVTPITPQDATAAVEVGTDSIPYVVYENLGAIYYQRLNLQTTGNRLDPTMPTPVQLAYDSGSIDYCLPNLAIDRDTIRREENIVDWDEPADNDRFVHVVFFGKDSGGMGTTFHLYYMKIDRDGDVLVEQKQVGNSGGGVIGTPTLYFPDMVVDSDNRIGVVATGTLQSGSWQGVPVTSIFYIKLDNNGQLLTANTLMNAIDAVNINNNPSGMYTYDEYRRPRIAINGDNEVHMVFEIMIGDDPPVPNIYHTRHYL